MKKQSYCGFLDNEYVWDKQLPMDSSYFDIKEDYSKCPKCGAFNKFEPDHSFNEIEDETCGNCNFDYQVSVTWTMNVDTMEEE